MWVPKFRALVACVYVHFPSLCGTCGCLAGLPSSRAACRPDRRKEGAALGRSTPSSEGFSSNARLRDCPLLPAGFVFSQRVPSRRMCGFTERLCPLLGPSGSRGASPQVSKTRGQGRCHLAVAHGRLWGSRAAQHRGAACVVPRALCLPQDSLPWPLGPHASGTQARAHTFLTREFKMTVIGSDELSAGRSPPGTS